MMENAKYRDPACPIEERVQDLMSRMTPREKIAVIIETSPANERLGIPKYNHGNEALHGIVRPGHFTVFPQAIALGATFDDVLLEEIAGVINICRDPRWARTGETYGEDPYLCGTMGAAFVRSLQGNAPKYLKAVAAPKHYTANNEEHNRFSCKAVMSMKTLREYPLEQFHLSRTMKRS